MAYLGKLLYNVIYIAKYVMYTVSLLLICIILHLWVAHYKSNNIGVLPRITAFTYNGTKLSYISPKYILLWDKYYLMQDKKKQPIFPNLQCKVKNCIFTEDRNLFGGDITHFDALLFIESALKIRAKLPEKRSKSQIYIFSTIESAYNQPACELFSDSFFNWTVTYRINSDILWSYFVVRNVTRHIIAPSMNVNWTTSARPISPSIKTILRGKTKAAAWLVSHCKADSLRDDYISRLQEHLFHFSIKIDVYGGCSNVKCNNDDCEEMFSRNYYFYLAFENSFSEDYVTEKVLHAYNNYAVPIVYGGADYNRFLPPGSYLNAREIHPYNLAHIIHETMKDPVKYEKYFRWTNSYTIDANVVGYHPLCELCQALHSKKARQRKTYRNFRLWWNGHNGMKWCLPEGYWNETSAVNVDGHHIFDTY